MEFRHYIDGLEVYVDTDHQNITWLIITDERSDRPPRQVDPSALGISCQNSLEEREIYGHR